MKLMKIAALTGLVFGVVANSHAGNCAIDPDVFGFKKTFTSYKGNEIIHSPNLPQDGIGTCEYVNSVCRSFGFDEAIDYEIKKNSYFDSNSQQWFNQNLDTRTYTSITCQVFL